MQRRSSVSLPVRDVRSRGRARAIMAPSEFARPGRFQDMPKPGCRVVPGEGGTRHGDAPAGCFYHACSPPRRASRSWIAWATRSPSSRLTSRRRPPACSTSSASSTPAGAGTPASGRAPRGWPGAWGWTWAPPGSGCGWRAPSARCRRLAEALARGELSYAKVRALTRVATPETEARLLAVGRAGTAAHVERIVRGWRRVDRQAEAREAARQHAGRALHVYQDEDGTVVLRGRLAPEVGALLLRALDAARETLYQRRRATEATGRPPTRPRSLRPGHSSRPTRWPCWPRRRCITSSTPGRRGSGIRWWSTWTPQSWRIRRNPANPCWKRGATFPRERRGDWRATQAGW